MRVGVHLLATATIPSIDLPIFGWGSALLSPLAFGSFSLLDLWTDMVVAQIWQTP